MSLSTFVCTRCAGIVQELHYLVKGVGLSTFKDKEVLFLEEMGNKNAKKIWLGKFDEKVCRFPNTKDLYELKHHIEAKYIEKKYYLEKDKDANSNEEEQSQSQNTTLSYQSCELKKSNSIKENKSVNMSPFNAKGIKTDSVSTSNSPDIKTNKASCFKKFQSCNNIIAVTSSPFEQTKPKSQFSNNNLIQIVPQTTKNTENTFTLNPVIATPTIITAATNMNSCKNTDTKSFDFNSFNKKTISEANNIFPSNNNNSNSNNNSSKNLPYVHNFTTKLDPNLMDTLKDIYSEKKPVLDPLDKLFYQYNFSTGNNMRVNNNVMSNQTNFLNNNQQSHFNNQQNNIYNNNQKDCVYRVNSNY